MCEVRNPVFISRPNPVPSRPECIRFKPLYQLTVLFALGHEEKDLFALRLVTDVEQFGVVIGR